MKIEIKADVLLITAETGLESLALQAWCKENVNTPNKMTVQYFIEDEKNHKQKVKCEKYFYK